MEDNLPDILIDSISSYRLLMPANEHSTQEELGSTGIELYQLVGKLGRSLQRISHTA